MDGRLNHVAEFTYFRGESPPARCSPPFGNWSAGNSDVDPLVAMHNMLMAHAKVADIYHDHFKVNYSKKQSYFFLFHENYVSLIVIVIN